MANITRYLQDIKSAIYGYQVRDSIHDAIDIINKVGEKQIDIGTAISAGDPKGSYYENSLYINTDTWKLLKCNGTTWVEVGSVRGAAGKGISNIEKTSTIGLIDTYTITYDDSTTTEFYVTNGEDGAPGADGQDGHNGNRWYRGTAISGKSVNPTVFSGSGIDNAYAGDCYLNTAEGAVYHCVLGGIPSVATWAYDLTMTGGGGGGDAVWGSITGTLADQTDLATTLAGKVDKVAGKGLSKNDYSDADKAIVNGVPSALEGKITEPSTEGTSGQVLTTDGAGGRSWENVPQPTVDQTFNGSSANAQSGVAISGALDSWTQEVTLASGNTATFTGLDDSLAYKPFIDDANAYVTNCAKTGSGTSVQLVYTFAGGNIQVGVTKVKLRILR